MRKLGLWGGCAVLLLALGLSAARAGAPPADDDDGKPAGPDPAARPRDGWNPFLTRLFSLDDKKPAPKPEKKDKEKGADKKADASAPHAAGPAEVTARYRALEEAKLRRRQDVCLRLREIARETHDEDLERKAIQLDQLAFEVFQERTLRLAGPAADAEGTEPGPSKDSGSTASVREVKP
jgi:hypothetical protein